ncbi:MAG TPA: 4Fe-4S binding protein [Candidatus Cryosericum sp.]|nr:4Fe-4S binding protein [Candidatus Cryosericum sp.]
MSATMQTASGRRYQRLALVSRFVRWVTLGSFLAFVLAATALHTLGYVAPSIHAICPYGGLESMLSVVAVGTFLKKIVIGTFVLFGTTVALALVLRRSFCGQLCAFGGLQEFFGKLGAKLFQKRPVMPKKLDKVLRYLKYVVLAVTVAMAWITGELWITPYDPFNALGHLADFNALITSYLVGFIVLIITLLGSLVYDRFFCKYLCPAGALYGLIGQASPYAVRVDAKSCIHCGKCSRACPMNLDVMNAKNGRVSSPECINCNECVNVCPVEGAIHTGFSKKAHVHPLVATLLALALFFAPMGIAAATGNMQLLPNKYEGAAWGTPAGEAETGGEGRQSGEGEVEAEESEDYTAINGYVPSDLRGSYTLSQTADLLGIPLETLYAKLGLPSDYPSGATLKDAAADMGLGLSDFKHQLFD